MDNEKAAVKKRLSLLYEEPVLFSICHPDEGGIYLSTITLPGRSLLRRDDSKVLKLNCYKR